MLTNHRRANTCITNGRCEKYCSVEEINFDNYQGGCWVDCQKFGVVYHLWSHWMNVIQSLSLNIASRLFGRISPKCRILLLAILTSLPHVKCLQGPEGGGAHQVMLEGLAGGNDQEEWMNLQKNLPAPFLSQDQGQGRKVDWWPWPSALRQPSLWRWCCRSPPTCQRWGISLSLHLDN